MSCYICREPLGKGENWGYFEGEERYDLTKCHKKCVSRAIETFKRMLEIKKLTEIDFPEKNRA